MAPTTTIPKGGAAAAGGVGGGGVGGEGGGNGASVNTSSTKHDEQQQGGGQKGVVVERGAGAAPLQLGEMTTMTQAVPNGTAKKVGANNSFNNANSSFNNKSVHGGVLTTSPAPPSNLLGFLGLWRHRAAGAFVLAAPRWALAPFEPLCWIREGVAHAAPPSSSTKALSSPSSFGARSNGGISRSAGYSSKHGDK
jgi:hypothetical protein